MVSKGVGKEEGIFLRLYQFFFLPRHFFIGCSISLVNRNDISLY